MVLFSFSNEGIHLQENKLSSYSVVLNSTSEGEDVFSIKEVKTEEETESCSEVNYHINIPDSSEEDIKIEEVGFTEDVIKQPDNGSEVNYHINIPDPIEEDIKIEEMEFTQEVTKQLDSGSEVDYHTNTHDPIEEDIKIEEVDFSEEVTKQPDNDPLAPREEDDYPVETTFSSELFNFNPENVIRFVSENSHDVCKNKNRPFIAPSGSRGENSSLSSVAEEPGYESYKIIIPRSRELNNCKSSANVEPVYGSYKTLLPGKSKNLHMGYICGSRELYSCKSSDNGEPVCKRSEHFGPRRARLKYICDKCDFKTSTKLSLERHKTSIHDHLFVCSLCDYSAKFSSTLFRHITLTHFKEFCDICEFKSDTIQQYYEHVHNAHSGQLLFTCKSCPFKAGTKRDLEEHEKTTHYAKPFVCALCGFNSICKSIFLRHLKIAHENVNEKHCSVCTFKTFDRFALRHHESSMHGLTVKCPVCSHWTYSKVELNNHMIKSHGDVNPYKCKMCDFKTNNIYYLVSHRSHSHKDCDPLMCQFCKFKATTIGKLNEHLTHTKGHFGKVYSCGICDYTTTRDNHLTKHIQKRHLKPMEGETEHNGQFTCTLCYYRYNNKTHLMAHMNFAHFRFHCDNCRYKTRLKKHMKEHILRIHLKIKPHSCKLCSYKAFRKPCLRKHIIRVHRNHKLLNLPKMIANTFK